MLHCSIWAIFYKGHNIYYCQNPLIIRLFGTNTHINILAENLEVVTRKLFEKCTPGQIVLPLTKMISTKITDNTSKYMYET